MKMMFVFNFWVIRHHVVHFDRLIRIVGRARLRPCHTTRYAGLHRAVLEVEVMRVRGSQEHQNI